MNVQDVKVICICFRILPKFDTTGIPSKYYLDIDELRKAIDENNRYKIILVCGANDIQQLDEIITSGRICKVYIYGEYREPTTGKMEVTTVNTNERDLMLLMIKSVMDYIHGEEIQEKGVGNDQKAKKRAENVLQLIEQMETLYRNGS